MPSNAQVNDQRSDPWGGRVAAGARRRMRRIRDGRGLGRRSARAAPAGGSPSGRCSRRLGDEAVLERQHLALVALVVVAQQVQEPVDGQRLERLLGGVRGR